MPEPGLTRFAPMMPTVPATSVVQAKTINVFQPSAPISLRLSEPTASMTEPMTSTMTDI